jgi:type IV pilus assembly protein PilV
MLEVLVSVLILAIGLLGLAGMYSFSLKNTANSNVRSVATTQAYDIIEKMRANRTGLDSGYYMLQQGQQHTSCFLSTGCTSQQMAQMDVFQWNELNALFLPGGVGIVCTDNTPNDGTPADPACDSLPNSNYVVKIWWDERVADGSLQRFITAFKP